MSAVLWKATLSGHLISAGLSPSTSLEPPVIKQFMLALVLAPIHLLAPAADSWPECRHDPTITERFLPVELINGEPLPATDVLQLVAIDKHYSFVAYYPSGEPPFNGETTLKGPIEQRRADGRVVQSYERTVPAATERMAITDNGQAMGRIFDERIGLISNEGKYPVGLWKQGETRHFNTVFHTARGDGNSSTSITMEKLSCEFEGISGAYAIRWRVDSGRRGDYGYVFAPGRGLVQVIVYKRAGSRPS
ncbi:MAG: hypothetical protein ABS84_07140 [Rubrivivax sp. SCN 71-131]|nr:MAG: hypothetical protein ABS84_07140 [Rubrivivax sp. SCN 71-131]